MNDAYLKIMKSLKIYILKSFIKALRRSIIMLRNNIILPDKRVFLSKFYY